MTTHRLLPWILGLVAGALLQPAVAQARLKHTVSLYGGADTWFRPKVGFHGIAQVAYDLEGLPASSHFGAEFNTDTLRVEFDRIRFAGGYLEAGARLTAEFFLAGVLSDYYRQGGKDSARGFNASYGALEAHLKLQLPRNHSLELAAGGRRWFFSATKSTASHFDLPPEAWVFEGRLRYTLWALRSDASLSERHRKFPRIRGLAFGVELGLDVRDDARAWGARDPDAFDPVDPRNRPGRTILLLRQWLRVGWQLHHRVRTQLSQHFAWGRNEDDLTRARIGGLNPYVVPLAGAAWPAFLSERFFAVQWSWHLRIWRELELGVLADAVILEDVDRVGASRDFDLLAGVGVFADLRFGAWQVDLRAGWSPSLRWQGETGHFSLYLGLGWRWKS
ncbi:MAG: hypothetical protein ABI333_29425 [bacterium]